MRIGVMGGSFDPPHHGHLILAREAARQLRLDRVLLVPAGVPPHKPGGPTIPAERRMGLVEAAVAGSPGLEASRIEVDRPGTSFTVDTLEEIAAANPGAALWFILGADQFAALPGWNRPGRIVEIARLAVAHRPGADGAAGIAAAGSIAAGRVDDVEMPEVPISSTLVRERLARGEGIRDLVPGPVADLLGAATSS